MDIKYKRLYEENLTLISDIENKMNNINKLVIKISKLPPTKSVKAQSNRCLKLLCLAIEYARLKTQKQMMSNRPQTEYAIGGYTSGSPELMVDLNDQREWVFNGKRRAK